MAGFRRGAGCSRRLTRCKPVQEVRLFPGGSHLCVLPGALRRRKTCASTDQGTLPHDPCGSSIPPDPPSLGAFAPITSGPPQTLKAAEPLVGLGPRSAAGSCEPRRGQETLRSSPAGFSSRSGSLPAPPLGNVDRAIAEQTPAFIDSRSGLSHQPNISVRVGIPLKRLAGG